MEISKLLFSTTLQQQEQICKAILQTNEHSETWGLSLSPEEATEITESRIKILKDYGRIEISTEIFKKIIFYFAPSPYVEQSQYANTLTEILEIFHYIKSEMDDDIGDEELIELLADLYNNTCYGDLELLAAREADRIIQSYKNGQWDYDKDL